MIWDRDKTIRALAVAALIVAVCLFAGMAQADFQVNQSVMEESAPLPDEFGEVVFRFNAASPNQLYVVAVSHRDSVTGGNGSNTVRAQADVYKIGEWLVLNEQVELLLPEGFFTRRADGGGSKAVVVKAGYDPGAEPASGAKTLEERLADIYGNPESILKESYRLKMRQVEDERLYEAAAEAIRMVAGCDNEFDYAFLTAELDYLQKRRTAAMLQRIPSVIAEEMEAGNISGKKALFTIGLYHIRDIIGYLAKNEISVHAPLFGPADDYKAGLNLATEGFGVTVIIPRTLLQDKNALAMTGMDEMLPEN